MLFEVLHYKGRAVDKPDLQKLADFIRNLASLMVSQLEYRRGSARQSRNQGSKL